MKFHSLNTVAGLLALAGAANVPAQTFTGTIRSSNTSEPTSGRTQRIYMVEQDGTEVGNRAPVGTQLWLVIDTNQDGMIAGLNAGQSGRVELDPFRLAFASGADTFFDIDPALMRVDGKAPGNQAGVFEQDIPGLPLGLKDDLFLLGWNPAGGPFNLGSVGDGVGPSTLGEISLGDQFAIYKLPNPTVPDVGNAFLPITEAVYLNNFTIVPEPATYAIAAGLGLAGFTQLRRLAARKR